MSEAIRAAGLPVLALLLTLGGLAKVITSGREATPGGLTRLGPAILIRETWRAPAMVSCALGEFTLAALLMAGTHSLVRWLTAAFFAVSTFVLVELRRRRPDVGCGCFGEVSSTPVGLRAISRTVVLTLLALGTVGVHQSGWQLVSGLGLLHVLGLAVVVGTLLLVSPELEETVARLRYQAPCELRPVDHGRGLEKLRSSATWRTHRPLLTSDRYTDSWRELCWRFMVFPGEAEGRPVDVVFAVFLSGRRPPIRVAVIDSDSRNVVTLQESIALSAGH
ncbi:MauE/DoxX family redox-associated membrane protein [Rhizohabitans arisaemae]|uniref:MauE/DoxX family redox-associated membrane protein n=1 Tax=Rhizohabitans arisaemae TaxID=2720610 RepID=UPI0024B22F83|nr:MauE/DoxX family redox-associated membrane protein [Rhizohabitans arisaemae]